MASTVGIHTQGAQNMPWQDLRTAREGGNGFDLRSGACAVAVSLGVGRLWPRNPHTESGSNAMRLAPGCPRSCAGSTRSAPKVRQSRPKRNRESAILHSTLRSTKLSRLCGLAFSVSFWAASYGPY